MARNVVDSAGVGGKRPDCGGLVVGERGVRPGKGQRPPCTAPHGWSWAEAAWSGWSRGGQVGDAWQAKMVATAGRKEAGRVRISVEQHFIEVEEVKAEQGTPAYGRQPSSTRGFPPAAGQWKGTTAFFFFLGNFNSNFG